MAKLIYSLIAVLILLVGCSNNSTTKEEDTKEEASFNETQKEVVDFINNDVAKISAYETEANEALETVTGDNFKSDEELYKVLINQVIPTYEKAVNEAKNMEVTSSELKPLKKQMEEATSTYYDALQLEKQGLETKEEDLFGQSNAKAQEYLLLIKDYHEDMGKLAKKYDIDYQSEQ